MKRLLLFVLLITAAATTVAEPTADERYFAYWDMGSLVRGGRVAPRWIDGGPGFWFARGADAAREILIVDADSSTPRPLFDVDRLRGALTAVLGEAPAGSGVPFADFTFVDHGASVRFDVSARSFVLRLSDYSLAEEPSAESVGPIHPPSDSFEVPSPDGSRIAVLRGTDLWVQSSTDDEARQLTDDGEDEWFWETWNASWSPDGRYLAAPKLDIRGLPTIPLVDWRDPDAPVERVESPRCDSARYGLVFHVIDLRTGERREVPTGDLDQPEPHPVGWLEASNELLLIAFDRRMRNQRLLAFDPATGAMRAIVSEHSDTFIDGQAYYAMIDGYHTPLGDGERFVWLSQRDGYHHLYLYRYDGTLERRLTGGDFPVVRVVDVDVDGGTVWFLAQPGRDHPFARHLCRVGLDGSGFRVLTEGTGRHAPVLSPDFSRFVDVYSDIDRPAVSELLDADGRRLAELDRADLSDLEPFGWTPPRLAEVPALADGLNCYAAIYLPPHFDPSRKYPVIEVIYAGALWPIVPHRFPAGEYGDTAAALSQLGYVTVIIDAPGTAGLSKAHQDAVFGRVGVSEIPEHVAALKTLAAERPWMDLERVGVHGKSWGGYFTLRAMLQAPEFYKVGVASASPVDLTTTAESAVVPYMGLPEDAPEAYETANCLPLADRLDGDLLLTIGTADRNTPFGQSMRMIAAFQEAGKDVDLVVFPGEHHWLQGSAYERWKRALRDHFLEHLPPEARR
jgi:dipeptidyl aminopeptidase/acylaminoacyl peptidase